MMEEIKETKETAEIKPKAPAKKTARKAAVSAAAPKPEKYYEAVGRRKTAVARVRLFTKGTGISVNEKSFEAYFPLVEFQKIVEAPLKKMKVSDKFRVSVKVLGGGLRGQAEAVRHGLSRALVEFNDDFRKRLKKAGFLTRDPREKERKKYGLKGARRAPQWSKR